MMLIVAPADETLVGVYWRCHWTCLVAAVVSTNVDIPELMSPRDGIYKALNMLVLGESTEALWAEVVSDCYLCGGGDTEAPVEAADTVTDTPEGGAS
ncbi:hypothetical protein Lsed01_00835 [Demequina sediminis]|uniref:Uncharacterized protein n=1 Tax=Demequina sediminis TaxID=1930058 RepID=A0ABP9WF20_9MICO